MLQALKALLFPCSAQVYELRQALLSEEAACVAAPAEEKSVVVALETLDHLNCSAEMDSGTRHSCLQGALDPICLTQNCCPTQSTPAKQHVSVWLFPWLLFFGLRSPADQPDSQLSEVQIGQHGRVASCAVGVCDGDEHGGV